MERTGKTYRRTRKVVKSDDDDETPIYKKE